MSPPSKRVKSSLSLVPSEVWLLISPFLDTVSVKRCRLLNSSVDVAIRQYGHISVTFTKHNAHILEKFNYFTRIVIPIRHCDAFSKMVSKKKTNPLLSIIQQNRVQSLNIGSIEILDDELYMAIKQSHLKELALGNCLHYSIYHPVKETTKMNKIPLPTSLESIQVYDCSRGWKFSELDKRPFQDMLKALESKEYNLTSLDLRGFIHWHARTLDFSNVFVGLKEIKLPSQDSIKSSEDIRNLLYNNPDLEHISIISSDYNITYDTWINELHGAFKDNVIPSLKSIALPFGRQMEQFVKLMQMPIEIVLDHGSYLCNKYSYIDKKQNPELFQAKKVKINEDRALRRPAFGFFSRLLSKKSSVKTFGVSINYRKTQHIINCLKYLSKHTLSLRHLIISLEYTMATLNRTSSFKLFDTINSILEVMPEEVDSFTFVLRPGWNKVERPFKAKLAKDKQFELAKKWANMRDWKHFEIKEAYGSEFLEWNDHMRNYLEQDA